MKKLILLLFISINCFGQVLSESEMRIGMTNILNLGNLKGTEKRDKLREYIETNVTKEATGKFAQEIATNKTTWANLFYSKFTATTVKGIINDLKAIADGSFGHRALDDETAVSETGKKTLIDAKNQYISNINNMRDAYTRAYLSVYSLLDGVAIPEKKGGLEAGLKSIITNYLDELTDLIPGSKLAKTIGKFGKDAILAYTEAKSEADEQYSEEINNALMTNYSKLVFSEISSAASTRFAIDDIILEKVLKANAAKYGKDYYENLIKSLQEQNSLATTSIGDITYQTLLFRFQLLETLINKIGPTQKDGFIIVETRLSRCGNTMEGFLKYLTEIDIDCPTIVRARYAIHGNMSTQFINGLNSLFADFKKAKAELQKKPSDMNISFLYRIHPPQHIGFDGYLTVPVTRKNGVINISEKISKKKGGFYNDTSDRNPTDEELLESEITKNTIGPKLLPIITLLNTISNQVYYEFGPTNTGKPFALDYIISSKTKREAIKR